MLASRERLITLLRWDAITDRILLRFQSGLFLQSADFRGKVVRGAFPFRIRGYNDLFPIAVGADQSLAGLAQPEKNFEAFFTSFTIELEKGHTNSLKMKCQCQY